MNVVGLVFLCAAIVLIYGIVHAMIWGGGGSDGRGT
jgi:hypothetical protein